MNPYLVVDGYKVVIGVNYVTRSQGGFSGVRTVGTYTNFHDMNKDMPRLIAELPSKHWTIEIDLYDYMTQEELDDYFAPED